MNKKDKAVLQFILMKNLTESEFNEIYPKIIALTDKKKEDNKMNLNKIMQVVSEYYQTPIVNIIGESRTNKLALIRFMFFFLARDYGYSTTQIGKLAGNRDHSSVIHGLRRMKKLIEEEKQWEDDYKKLTERLSDKGIQWLSEDEVFPVIKKIIEAATIVTGKSLHSIMNYNGSIANTMMALMELEGAHIKDIAEYFDYNDLYMVRERIRRHEDDVLMKKIQLVLNNKHKNEAKMLFDFRPDDLTKQLTRKKC